MRLAAAAKINLHLRVGRARIDGFHPLLTWMCTIGLFDSLLLERAGDSGVALVSDLPELPCDERNLVVQLAAAWGAALAAGEARGAEASPPASGNRQIGGFRVALGKRIPIGAGLGGGSADGARTLLGLNQLCEAGWTRSELAEFAAPFGSDLAFFFFGASSICRGRGEIVKPIDPPRPRWALLVLPRISISTARVYAKFDEMQLGRDEQISEEPQWREWTKLSAGDLLPRLVNDLEPAAFALEPSLRDLRDAAQRKLGRAVRMSGSGSSLFTLYDEEAEASKAAAVVEGLFYGRAVAVAPAPEINDDLKR